MVLFSLPLTVFSLPTCILYTLQKTTTTTNNNNI